MRGKGQIKNGTEAVEDTENGGEERESGNVGEQEKRQGRGRRMKMTLR